VSFGKSYPRAPPRFPTDKLPKKMPLKQGSKPGAYSTERSRSICEFRLTGKTEVDTARQFGITTAGSTKFSTSRVRSQEGAHRT
jgi:hypothetical protein